MSRCGTMLLVSLFVVAPAVAQDNLLPNGGFEDGLDGWMVVDNSGRLKAEASAEAKRRGDQGLRIEKSGGPPVDVIRANIAALPAGKRVKVSAMIKADKARNAWFKFFVYDDQGNVAVQDVDIKHITGSFGWRRFSKTYELPANAKSGAVIIMMVMGGTVYVDDVRVTPTEETADAKTQAAEDGSAGIPSRDLRAADNPKMRYFLIGPRPDARRPKRGYRLLIVLPGGDGGADFHPFVKRIAENALPDSYLVAQPVAFKWTAGQKITWPTNKNPVDGMIFSTEDFVDAVVEDAGKRHKLDDRHIYALGWSSGGPAVYALSLRKKTPIRGSYVAMSVFVPKRLPSLKRAKGHAYYLDHSPDDAVCKFFFAKNARKALAANGAEVELVTYEGGHGWHGDVFGRIAEGVKWLEKNRARVKRAKKTKKKGG